MRILHTGDWHLGRTLEGRGRLEEQASVLEEIAAIADDQKIDLILMAGDVYDTVNPPAAAEQLFYETAARMTDGGRRHLVCIAGNHDQPERVAASSPLARRHGIHLVGLPTTDVLRLSCPRTGETAIVAALPYPSESRLQEALSDVADEELLRSAYSNRVARLIAEQARHFRADAVNLITSHLYAMGGVESESERPIQVGGAYTVDLSAFDVPAAYVALGHLHRAQKLGGSNRIRYSGSPLAYSFSEAGQTKSVTVLDIAPGLAAGEPSWTEIPLSAGRPLVRWKADEGVAQVFRWIEEGRDPNAWIDLEVKLTEDIPLDTIHRLRTERPGFVHIRPIYPEQQSEREIAAQRGLPMDELFRRFYRKQTGGAEPDDAMVELFLELIAESGAAADAAEGEEAS
ncbi:exonuclease SbcCD subunit D [Paenibacillus thermoaerophilus]|uniref:Nuclease SbcCD subunit D n=1 Tax=Paenibacillus thermoaerophilus TaxID=1215385 RepID=A0ABW2UXG8_9BACL|nr:exonuclease SbcCD subunit D [Paenibacillus thermoaerophilus]TMV19007.1 exonuclease SbcCD subunit D [Paenibacillus thermoaerophilus]